MRQHHYIRSLNHADYMLSTCSKGINWGYDQPQTGYGQQTSPIGYNQYRLDEQQTGYGQQASPIEHNQYRFDEQQTGYAQQASWSGYEQYGHGEHQA
jgi:hypothetical protein